MNVLIMGLPFGADWTPVKQFVSLRDHQVRTLALSGPADYQFTADETAEQVVCRIARKWRPDLFVCWLPELFPPPLEMEQCPIATGAVFSDWNIYHGQLDYNLCRFDAVLGDLLASREARFRGIRSGYIGPIYSQRSTEHVARDVAKDIDVLFAGNLNHSVHRERGRCLETLARMGDRHRVVITSGYEGAQYARLLSRARIVFNYAVRREMNLRSFEALACGSLLFVERGNLEVPQILADRQEVILYDPETLVETIDYYLGRPREAQAIAAAGHDRAPGLAGEARLDDFIDWFGRQGQGERAFRQLDEPAQRLAGILLNGSSLQAAQQRYAGQAIGAALSEWPDRPEFHAAQAAHQLRELVHEPDRGAATQRILQHLREVCRQLPDSAVAWSNLAFVCQRAGAPDAEARFWQLALEATGSELAPLLFGEVTDPWYVAWRRASATRDCDVAILHGRAACRLAQLALARGDFTEAGRRAEQAGEMSPGYAAPVRTGAEVALAQGQRKQALTALRESLSATSFDAEHREQLIELIEESGAKPDAMELARESATIFSVCEGMEPIAERFREHLTRLQTQE